MPNKVDIINKRFGRIVVLSDTGKRSKAKRIIYSCACDCGKIFETEGASLRSGDTKSCGCLKIDKQTTHRSSNTKLYRIWADMLSRCRSVTCGNYKNYGAKGVTVCQEWIKFESFKEWSLNNGYELGLSIDRKNPHGNYEPDNCRWATRKQQDFNKRNSRFVNISGKLISLYDVSIKYNIGISKLAFRYSRGIKDDRIILPGQRGRKLE